METIKKISLKTKILLAVACVCLILGIVFCIIGFDKKNNYYNSESFYSLNVNAYVGGDAYNFIINGTYFAGYLALAGAMFICGCTCGVSGLLFASKEEEKQVAVPKTDVSTTESPETLQASDTTKNYDVNEGKTSVAEGNLNADKESVEI